MIGGLKRSSSSLAILAAAGLFAGGVSSAQAADLGGDCCADLEERVAELEATAVRHGNRAVRLTLSGQVNSELMYWDDGVDSDVYVIDSDEASSRIRLDAVGTISPGVTAGLVIEFDIEIAGGLRIAGLENDRGNGQVGTPPVAVGSGVQKPDDDGDAIQLRRANWFINGGFGRISVGQGSMASDGAFEVSFANTWVASVGYGLGSTNMGVFQMRGAGALNTSWYDIGSDYDTGRRNRVRYDSPTFAGFTLSGSWGEDDEYDVAARYANEFGGLRVAAAVAYHKDKDDNGAADDRDDTRLGGSIAFMFNNIHVEGGYSQIERENIVTGATLRDDEHMWIAAGVQFRGSSLGMSDITIDYIVNEATGTIAGVAGSVVDYESYGIGFAQNIDAVGGTFYMSYRHHEADDNLGQSVDFEQVQLGMRLRY